MKQYLSLGSIPERVRKQAQRLAKINGLSRRAGWSFKSETEIIEADWEEYKKTANPETIKFWESKLIWEDGPNPPYLRTQFVYDKDGLQLIIVNDFLNIQMQLALTTEDKIAMINAINKDNNRIKNMLETDKTKEHQTDELKPYYDAVRSKDVKNGIEWSYIKDGKVEDTAFMSYRELYEIQIGKSRKCQFCDETKVQFIMPRDQGSGIYLCEQHLKYIQRLGQRECEKTDEV